MSQLLHQYDSAKSVSLLREGIFFQGFLVEKTTGKKGESFKEQKNLEDVEDLQYS